MELVALPVEIIQLIAGYLLVSPDVLSLARTCHTLHNACHNTTVFQQSFELYLPEISSQDIGNKEALVCLIRDQVERQALLQREDPKTLWFLLAVGTIQIPKATQRLARIAAVTNTLASKGQRVSPGLKTRLRSAVLLLSTLAVWRFDTASDTSVVGAFDALCPTLLAESLSKEYYRIDKLLGLESAVHFAFSFALSNLQSAHKSLPHALDRDRSGRDIGSISNTRGPHASDIDSVNSTATDCLVKFVRSVYEGVDSWNGLGYLDGFGIYPQGAQTQALLLIVLITRIIRHDDASAARDESGRRNGGRLLARLPQMGKVSLFGNRPASRPASASPSPPNGMTSPPPPMATESPSRSELIAEAVSAAAAATAGAEPARPTLCPLYCHVDQAPSAFRRDACRASTLRGPVTDTWSDWYVEQALAVAGRIGGSGVGDVDEDGDEEEEWYGFYTHRLDFGTRLDAPMEGIRFRKAATTTMKTRREPGGGDHGSRSSSSSSSSSSNGSRQEKGDGSGKTHIEATGCRDGYSSFAFRGHVGADLSVSLHKEHATHAFAYDGTVTPLGICGTYRLLTGSQVLGYFWIWPRAWMAEGAA